MSKTTKKIAIGTMLVGAVGYVAGILTAPKSGKETRQDIKTKAQEISGEAEEKLKSLHKDMSKHADTMKKQVLKLKGSAKDKAEVLQKDIESAKERAKSAISALRAGEDQDEIDEVIADLERLKTLVSKHFKAAASELKK